MSITDTDGMTYGPIAMTNPPIAEFFDKAAAAILIIQIPAKCQRCGDNEVAAVSERFGEFVCSNCDEYATCGTRFESIDAWAERLAAGRYFEYEVV